MKTVTIALFSLLLSSLVARADDVPAGAVLKASIERDFLTPFAKRQEERAMMSRARRPPTEFRIGVVQASAGRDARGLQFSSFSIDQRYVGAAKWTEAAMTGCVYEDGAMFVKRGEEFAAASFLLGKKSPNPPAGVCKAAEVAVR